MVLEQIKGSAHTAEHTKTEDVDLIEFVPLQNLEGKAVVSFWSTDGNANWFLPWTWFTAARWSRIGEGF